MRLSELREGEQYILRSDRPHLWMNEDRLMLVRVLSLNSPPPGAKLEVEVTQLPLYGNWVKGYGRVSVAQRLRISASLLICSLEEWRAEVDKERQTKAKISVLEEHAERKLEQLQLPPGCTMRVEFSPEEARSDLVVASLTVEMPAAQAEKLIDTISHSLRDGEPVSPLAELLGV